MLLTKIKLLLGIPLDINPRVQKMMDIMLANPQEWYQDEHVISRGKTIIWTGNGESGLKLNRTPIFSSDEKHLLWETIKEVNAMNAMATLDED